MEIHSSILAWEIPRTEEPGVKKSWPQLNAHMLHCTALFLPPTVFLKQ